MISYVFMMQTTSFTFDKYAVRSKKGISFNMMETQVLLVKAGLRLLELLGQLLKLVEQFCIKSTKMPFVLSDLQAITPVYMELLISVLKNLNRLLLLILCLERTRQMDFVCLTTLQ